MERGAKAEHGGAFVRVVVQHQVARVGWAPASHGADFAHRASDHAIGGTRRIAGDGFGPARRPQGVLHGSGRQAPGKRCRHGPWCRRPKQLEGEGILVVAGGCVLRSLVGARWVGARILGPEIWLHSFPLARKRTATGLRVM